MDRMRRLATLSLVAATAVVAGPLFAEDPRDIRTGYVIPDEGYCDQPYVVITDDGNWLCLLTTAGGHEGAANSHVVSTISADQGRTWSKLVELEPTDGPPSVYSLPVVARSGRVYVFYDYNGDNFRCPGRSDCVGGSSISTLTTTVAPGRRSVTTCPCG